jgi:uncharacterized protein (TIGR03790 family)
VTPLARIPFGQADAVRLKTLALFVFAAQTVALAGKPENVLVVANDQSALSRSAADYYIRKRTIPKRNVCFIKTTAAESVSREIYDKEIALPVMQCLKSRGLVESVLYIVTTAGVPLRVKGAGSMTGDVASVDSELTLLYKTIKGEPPPTGGPLDNPFYRRRDVPFTHPLFPIYLVTRLAGYDLNDIRGAIDRAQMARNAGKVVLDLRAEGSSSSNRGNEWLRTAAILLPRERVFLEETTAPVYGAKDVIGYGSWGSNDSERKKRKPGFTWLPGAIVTEFVSTNGRTFQRPPETWNISTWKQKHLFFEGSPQTLAADYINEGATGTSGHVSEPYLGFTPRPEILFPAYLGGRNLAESYWMSIPALSWQNIVIGDPLCSLGKPVSTR